jgi:hypothetical protein
MTRAPVPLSYLRNLASAHRRAAGESSHIHARPDKRPAADAHYQQVQATQASILEELVAYRAADSTYTEEEVP